MAKRKRAKKKTGATMEDLFADLLRELDLPNNSWSVTHHFTKGVLSGGRGAVVEVANLKTGKRLSKSTRAGTKNEARRAAVKIAHELLVEMSTNG